MPQMVTPPLAAPQASPKAKVSSQGNKENNEFSPHLKDAISSKKQQQQTDQTKNRKETSSSTENNPLIDKNSQALESQQSENNPDSSTATGEDLAAGQNGISEQTPFNTEKQSTGATESVLLPIQQVNVVTNPSLNASTETGNASNPFKPAPTLDAVQPPPTPLNIEPEIQKAIKPVAPKGQDALLNQLQSIIDKANETGIVSITKVPNTTLANSMNNNIHGIMPFSLEKAEPANVTTAVETTGINLTGILVADAEGVEKASGKSAQHMNGIRQDSQHQYFSAKINMQNLTDNNQNFQENQAGDELPQQTAGSNLSNGLFSAPEQTNTFSQISATVQETTTQSITDSAKPIVLPSGVIVHEDEIIQQLSQRFQISSRHMDSRINLKLHPAELGALKIDLTVKEGSIRANVVAQSQHTLEILEKNMAKLKTVLENQGFTVDEISITAESDSVSDFDLFDRQLFSHNDYTPKNYKNRREEEPVFTLADNVFAAPTMNTGVNVKI